MRFKKKLMIIPVLLGVILIYIFFIRDSGAGTGRYVFAELSRGDLEILTSSTGTLQPVSLVDISTQVSGRVDRVLADYNTIVKEGQVLAVLDTLQLAINHRSAKNELERAQAQFNLIQREFTDKQRLFERDFISELELYRAETDLTLSRISLLNAKSNLERAELNLYDYAVIRSPINGIIIDKAVEEGQTVAASMAAPVLFTVAADLENMEIRAQVDETDIGLIKAGQRVRYTVDSYPERTFTGIVRDVRIKPEIISNVVIYTAVISTQNPEGILIPGMTATIDFIISHKEDVLLAPATALRWMPPEDVMHQVTAQQESEADAADSGSSPGAPPGTFSGRGAGNTGRLWSLDKEGNLQMHRVRLGETDGINTEIIPLEEKLEGLEVIVNRLTPEQAQRASQKPLGAPSRMRF